MLVCSGAMGQGLIKWYMLGEMVRCVKSGEKCLTLNIAVYKRSNLGIPLKVPVVDNPDKSLIVHFILG